VHRLIYDSLATFGVLALGDRESMRYSPLEDRYRPLDAQARLFTKVR
jgi:chemotaxis protein methyltransferase CheR